MLPTLDSAPCGFVSLSDDGTMLDLNTTLAESLGYTKVELAGWHLQKILPPGAREGDALPKLSSGGETLRMRPRRRPLRPGTLRGLACARSVALRDFVWQLAPPRRKFSSVIQRRFRFRFW